MSRSRVTIRDVAAEAGVSHQTVSRVINDSERVAPATRAKVEAAITTLEFRPNAAARSMARGRTGMLACIAPNLIDYTFASLIHGAETAARDAGFFLLSASAEDADTFAALIDEMVTSRRTEAIIVINPFADDRYKYLPENFPLVFAGARTRQDAINSVALNDEDVGYQATHHLLQLGHRQIGMITGPIAEDCTQDRFRGCKMALAEFGLEPMDGWVIEGDWSARSGYETFMTIAQMEELPTAIFAQNDLMAAGVIRAARNMQIRIPDDLSLIGVDDIPIASYFTPPLTTLHQDFEQIGAAATRLLLLALDNPAAPPQQLQLPAQLISRQSAAFYKPE